MPTFSRRGIVRHPKFEEHLDQLQAHFPRVREIVHGVEWALAREPELGVRIPDIDVWVARLSAGRELLPLRIYYTFTNRIVYMLLIELAENQPS